MKALYKHQFYQKKKKKKNKNGNVTVCFEQGAELGNYLHN